MHTSHDYLAFVANKATAGGSPRVVVIAGWKMACSCEEWHTISLFQEVRHKICFTRMVESRDGEFELV